MQRPTAILVLAAVAVLTGLRLAAAVQDTEAMRCAIACGHAAGMMNGAACCPMSGAPESSPVFKRCSRPAEAAIAPLAPAPALLAPGRRLPAPDRSHPFDWSASAAGRSAFLDVPDKVPLLVG